MRRLLLAVLLSSVSFASFASPASASTWLEERDCFELSSGEVCSELWMRFEHAIYYMKARAYVARGRFYITAVNVRKNCCETLARAPAGWLSARQVKDTPWANRGLLGCLGADYSAVVGFRSTGNVSYQVWSHPGAGQGPC
jgi:hypothetical protein